MKSRIAVLAAFTLVASTAAAQRVESFGFELRPFVGAFVPMGAQRDDFKDATTVAGQAAWELSDHWHILGSIGWTHGHHKFASVSKDNTYIIHYDIGTEANLMKELGVNWLWKPFAGVGVGARSYDYGADAVDTKTCSTGYASMGTEFQRGVVALRVEGRQYLNCFESPITGKKATRTDGMFGFGLAYHLR